MVYRTNLSVKGRVRQKLTLSDFSGGMDTRVSQSLLPVKYAVKMHNFEGSSGALRHTPGFAPLKLTREGVEMCPELGGEIKKLYYYKRYDHAAARYDDKLIALDADGYLNYIDINAGYGGFKRLYTAAFEGIPTAVNYRLNGADVIIFSSEQDTMLVWDGKNPPYKVPGAPNISSACVHYERLFVTVGGEKSAVWFSDDLDPTNWDISLTGAGFIEIADGRGALSKVVQFLDYVYIFRSYGISRLTAYAEQTQFSVIPLYVSSGKIFPDTVALCGDRIIFMASDGFYSFNGLSTVKILQNISDTVMPAESARAAFHNGKYYLACALKKCGGGYGSDHEDGQGEEDGGNESCGTEQGGTLNNALMQYSLADGSCVFTVGAQINDIIPVDTENGSFLAMSAGGGQPLCTLNGDNTDPAGQPLLKVWESPVTDFSRPDRQKLIREIHLETSSDIQLAVFYDKLCKRFSLRGKKGVQKINCALRGNQFRLVFLCKQPAAEITKPVITFDII